MVAIATKAKTRATREILVFVMHLIFILHLIFKDLNSRSVERVYGNTHQGKGVTIAALHAPGKPPAPL
jgi:hypothetical protein